jgi:hypothetical protein
MGSIRDRLKSKTAQQQPVIAVEDESIESQDELEEVEVKPSKTTKSTKSTKTKVVEPEPVEDELEDEVVEVKPSKTTKTKTKVVEPEPVEDELEDELIESQDELEEEELEEEVKPSKTTKSQSSKVKSSNSTPAFIKAKSETAAKTYEDGDWLPRKEYLNKLVEACKGTAFENITKAQMTELMEIIEKTTVEILQSNDVTIFGEKTKTIITNPRLYNPRKSGLTHVKTEYYSLVNSHREVTIKLRFGRQIQRGGLDGKGNFVEGKIVNSKLIPGTWINKDEFVPAKK